jgi:arylsulfatase
MLRSRLGWLGVLLLAGPAAGCGREAEHARGLVLVTVDTYRADHFLEERAGQALTPHLAEFAARAERFASAHSVSNCTTPGTAGILTGLLPRRSGVVSNLNVLPGRLASLATRLRAAGFRTGAVVSNPVLRPGTGFENGFDQYRFLRSDEEDRPGKPRAARVNAAALEWLDALASGARFFLWVHYMEPHGPYDPRPELRELFPREAFEAPRDVPLHDDNGGLGGIPRYQQKPIPTDRVRDAREYLSRYAGEVRALDADLGDFLGELDERGLLAASVVVLTADHGEALAGDAGYFFSHDNGLTQDQIHVPLLLAYPGCMPGAVHERAVSTVDVLPTVLPLLGLEATGELDGLDLLQDVEREAVSQIATATAVRSGPWTLVWSGGGEAELFDLSGGDPGVPAQEDAPRDVRRRLQEKLREVEKRPPLEPSVERTERPHARRDAEDEGSE